MKDIALSVIIPVYNGEKYIEEAVMSVLEQPYNEIEIICINDGSSDKSLEILNGLARKNDRVKIFNQKNQGVAKSRNEGIKNASGEYVAFLDQDDVWFPNAIDKKDMDEITSGQYEMISFSYCDANQEISRFDLKDREDKIVKKGYEAAGENYRHHSSYFYKRQFLIKNNIWVDEYRNEDERFRMQAVYLAKDILYKRNILFAYRNNRFSVTHSKKKKKTEVLLSCIKGYKKLYFESKNSLIRQYCNDSIIRLFLELLIAEADESGCKKTMENNLVHFEFANYWEQRGWMSEKDKKTWKLYFDNKTAFIWYYKVMHALEFWLRVIKMIKPVELFYETKKYPLSRKEIEEKL